jgi:HIV Tat-specific factor 1
MPDPTDQMTFAGKNSRVVVLKHMFSVEDIEQDASLMLDLKEDVREECSTLGEVTNVVLYDVDISVLSAVYFIDVNVSTARTRWCHDNQVQRPSQCTGLCSGEPYFFIHLLSSFLRVVQKMNGRYFDKRRVEAEIFTGKQRFKRSGTGDEIEGGGEDVERKRLDDFAKWIMTEGD